MRSKEQNKAKPAVSRPLKRRLVVDGVAWTYHVGSGGITVRAPTGDKTRISMTEFSGWSSYDLERLWWKSRRRYPVMPGDLAAWIRTRLVQEVRGG